MISQALLRSETKKQSLISRPSSKSNNFLPEIIQTPSSNQLRKQQNSILIPSKGMDLLNLHKIPNLEPAAEQFTSRIELQRKELIREIFREEKKQSILKPFTKQQYEQNHRHIFKKEENMQDQQMQLKSILKRKSSNSREHTDIFDFFELDNQDFKQQQQQKSNLNMLKHNKQVSLQPIQKEDYSPKVSPGKKIVSFNRQIQIKVIDPNEEKPKSNQKSFRRLYTMADLLDKQ
ncbi:unnamed protein product (macronuclear) [Paramecium tetraurelia]|uniref:Uncharacterized protein n=1 Tax=Paramecium tetraurelia TaxID=5888 RepID=A0BPH2_PARTE|nr:uncharacterized protein GSPATT00005188001 [Paramecium tetraurelia]CAK60439.1 unnamed protein product [Paramecium tetraurelia]|eukprot:XP_001427837.1 hypothetical protein (macronuclear) [Paramecium tetraurelia strain d4-2]